MKKVSCKMFFYVLSHGISQSLGWFFGLFGYKRDGRFAKCVWGVFSVSAAILMALFACVMLYAAYDNYYSQYRYFHYKEDYGGQFVSRNIGFVAVYGGKEGYLINKKTKEKVLKGIDWIAKPLGNDSLVCFSNGKLRGYFNAKNGKVVVEPKYEHAWVFSDGIASVEENGIIKFIDTKGNQVFDRTFAYDPEHDGYVFHGGYCIVDEDNDQKYGLMNTKGITILPEEYTQIELTNNLCFWTLTKDNESGVVDKDLNTVLPMMACDIYIFNDEIDVTMADNTMRKYDIQGNLIDDFYINDFEYLEYEHPETYQIVQKESDEYGYEHEYVGGTEHKTARARLCKYSAGNRKEGLMTPEGHMVTLPKYEYIDAVGPDTYICTVSNGDKELINGKGDKVK